MHFFGLLRARRLAGADGPHGLIGDDGARERGDARQIEHGVQLAIDHFERAAGFALGEQFADAEDRGQAGAKHRGKLARHQLIGLAEQGAPFGMADDRARATDVLAAWRRTLHQ